MKLNPAFCRAGYLQKSILSIFLCLLGPLGAIGQNPVVHGPMLGYVTQTEAGLWIQTKEPIKGLLVFNTPGREGGRPFQTKEEDNFATIVALNDLLPGTTYTYYLQIDTIRSKTWEFRTRPEYQEDAPQDFSLVFGSCSDFDPELTQEEQEGTIFDAIASQKPDLMIWLGDNIYFKEEDFESRDNMFKRYSIARSKPYIQDLLNTTHHYAIWDDHDFGPNNSNSSFAFKKHSLEAFQKFWVQKDYVFQDEAITHRFTLEDAEFFMLDNRSYRIVNEDDPKKNQIWGLKQIDWLKNSLKESKATFKIICTGGQFLSDAPVFENHVNVAPSEREDLIEMIQQEKIQGVIFLTGDRHSSELTAMPIDQERTIFDWTISPFRAKTYDHSDENNSFRVNGSMFAEHMFGRIDFSGEKTKRELEFKGFNRMGQLVWAYKITQEMLY